jgi:hypothetical protein
MNEPFRRVGRIFRFTVPGIPNCPVTGTARAGLTGPRMAVRKLGGVAQSSSREASSAQRGQTGNRDGSRTGWKRWPHSWTISCCGESNTSSMEGAMNKNASRPRTTAWLPPRRVCGRSLPSSLSRLVLNPTTPPGASGGGISTTGATGCGTSSGPSGYVVNENGPLKMVSWAAPRFGASLAGSMTKAWCLRSTDHPPTRAVHPAAWAATVYDKIPSWYSEVTNLPLPPAVIGTRSAAATSKGKLRPASSNRASLMLASTAPAAAGSWSSGTT